MALSSALSVLPLKAQHVWSGPGTAAPRGLSEQTWDGPWRAPPRIPPRRNLRPDPGRPHALSLSSPGSCDLARRRPHTAAASIQDVLVAALFLAGLLRGPAKSSLSTWTSHWLRGPESTASVNKRGGLFRRETWGLARGRLTPGILAMQNKGPPVTQCKQITN